LTLPDPDDAQIPGWAEGPNENTDDPEIYRERGYQDPDSFASADLNKNLQQIYRWIDTALEGGAARLTGDYGEVEIGNDDSSLFELVINAGSQGLSNLTSWALDQIKVIKIKGNGVTFIEVVDQNDNASGFLLESLRAVTGINDLIKILDEDGNVGEGGALLDILQAGTSDEISVDSSSGTVAEGGFRQDFVRPPTGQSGSIAQNDVVNFKDQGGVAGEGMPVGLNTPNAVALLNFDPNTINNGDTITTDWASDDIGITYQGRGEYRFNIGIGSTVLQSNIAGEASFIGNNLDGIDAGNNSTNLKEASVNGTADNQATVNVFDDSNTRVDPSTGRVLCKLYWTY